MSENSPVRHRIDGLETMRKTIKDLVFEPSGEIPENTINLFTGLPPQADVSTDKCQKILGHIDRLCGFRKDEYDWLLRWMAYPLQNLGAKMDTAVIMYGSVSIHAPVWGATLIY